MTPAQQWSRGFAKFSPEVRTVARGAIARMRRRLPGAVEFVYDNYNALVIAFGASQRMADIVLSIALYPRWVTLFFMNGTKLKDPKKLLEGSGSKIRGIRLADGVDLGDPDVIALVEQAAAKSSFRKRELIIKSISKKQRPRRPG